MFKILIVEDSRPYRESLKEILDGQYPNIFVEGAENAKEAMEKADLFGPNLIFMDIGLPDGSGLELTKIIKAKHPNVSVVILTSYDIPEYREAAIRYGANHFLTKGVVTREEIQDLVKSSISEVS